MRRNILSGGLSSGVLFSGLLVATLVVSLKFGAVEIAWQEIFAFLSGRADGTAPDVMILRELRLPRILCGMLAGGAFAVSGVIMQGVLRNPLASPEVTGVSAGGALAGLAGMLLFAASAHTTLLFVFCGALLTALAVTLLAWNKGVDPLRLILAGVAFSALCGAAGSFLMYLESDKASQVLAFALGSLASRSIEDLAVVFPLAFCGFATAFFMAKKLDILQLGDDTASSLGVRVELSRGVLVFSAVMLASSAVSLAGVIGFAGLVIPHITRLLYRSNSSCKLMVRSAVLGAVFVTLCDTAGRSIVTPAEIPAGVLTSLAGPPFFLWLLFRKGRSL
ncbi:MAG: iron ABC transporter permease [Lentisphaeria bacterium]|nr:iron ABC transporter permease [Lentisphaeria bacterium]